LRLGLVRAYALCRDLDHVRPDDIAKLLPHIKPLSGTQTH
jgi:hypothetical protein